MSTVAHRRSVRPKTTTKILVTVKVPTVLKWYDHRQEGLVPTFAESAETIGYH